MPRLTGIVTGTSIYRSTGRCRWGTSDPRVTARGASRRADPRGTYPSPESARPHLEEIGRWLREQPWAYSGEPGEIRAVVRRWAGLPVIAPTGPASG
jgi:hypothetical protein